MPQSDRDLRDAILSALACSTEFQEDIHSTRVVEQVLSRTIDELEPT